ncbi:hypothetical protein N8E88_08980 (plasmid) [Phyllobacterium zundukense]|uniref:Uncharacterized protein n=1 Tax=Phyllobacterium zundukense TaxID=1867719 RepID=A0ACD4D073_9HYPH|nr:hypothetical protein N8E88_08980 [Phyllobacterium zundukense]
MRDPRRNNDLWLAQHHAFQLARTLIVPVTLFRPGEEFGILPSQKRDHEDDLKIVYEFDPWPAH